MDENHKKKLKMLFVLIDLFSIGLFSTVHTVTKNLEKD